MRYKLIITTVHLILCFGVIMSTRKSETHTIVWISNTAFERLKLVLFATEHGSAVSWFEQSIGTFIFSFTGDKEGKKRWVEGAGGWEWGGGWRFHSLSQSFPETRGNKAIINVKRIPSRSTPK